MLFGGLEIRFVSFLTEASAHPLPDVAFAFEQTFEGFRAQRFAKFVGDPLYACFQRAWIFQR